MVVILINNRITHASPRPPAHRQSLSHAPPFSLFLSLSLSLSTTHEHSTYWNPTAWRSKKDAPFFLPSFLQSTFHSCDVSSVFLARVSVFCRSDDECGLASKRRGCSVIFFHIFFPVSADWPTYPAGEIRQTVWMDDWWVDLQEIVELFQYQCMYHKNNCG